MKYIIGFVFITVLISCSSNINNSDFYGKWRIENESFEPFKVEIKDKAILKNYNEQIQLLKDDSKNEVGKYIIFNSDSTFISENQPLKNTYWTLNKDKNEILFSDSNKPFKENYFFYIIMLENDKLITKDNIKNVGCITTVWKKNN